MNIEEYQEAQRPDEARQRQYEQDCAQVPSGHLSAHDVCRVFSHEPYSNWSGMPGEAARALVEELALPLMEIGNGRWVVRHAIEGANL